MTVLPTTSGIYFFKDAQGEVIYIGKAKNIRRRVASYFQKQPADVKTAQLMQKQTEVGFVPTRTEIEALLLEAALIKAFQPEFNIELKEGAPLIYLVITTLPKQDLPTLSVVREGALCPKRSSSSETYCFGPFIKRGDARTLHEYLIRTFRIFVCGKHIPNGCLDYHLGRCAGSCRPDFDRAGYLTRLKLAQAVLEGNYRTFVATITAEIEAQNTRLAFERSRELHQILQSAESVFATLKSGVSQATYIRHAVEIMRPEQLSEAEYDNAAHALQKLLDLPIAPVSIDCFDISHFQGAALVGACVRFVNGKPAPDKFRRFKIKTLTQQNDYAALQEIVQRRYAVGDLPDLVLIDGGKGQRNAIAPLIAPTPCVSLAKKEELLISALHPNGIPLDVKTTAGKLLINLRNHTHHFAISYHRLRRSKNLYGV